MRRPPDPDQLAVDDDTLERLLTGGLPPAQAPSGYAEVARLLAAAVAAPSPGELAGQAAALEELRAVTRARPAATTTPRSAATGRRRRRTGLAVVVVAGALAAGGVAGAATGHLPGQVREAARTILATGGGEPPASTRTGPRPAPVTGTGGAAREGSRPGGATGGRLGPVGAGPAASPDLEGLCQAFRSGNGAELGGKLDAASFRVLARAAGGEDKVAAFCEAIPPADDKPKEPSASKEPGRPGLPGGGGNQGQQGGPGTSSQAPGR
ncbi:MAG TPA: hypothetical protein VE265_00755 [Actinomycetota bacterium]|nr:hypothetical protein [Actinomycetota bacterium]